MLIESATNTLLAAGYNKADICHYATTDIVFRIAPMLMVELSHLRDEHDDLVAADLHVATLTFIVTRAPDMAKMLKALGGTREIPTNGPALLSAAIEQRDKLAEKLACRESLRAELHA